VGRRRAEIAVDLDRSAVRRRLRGEERLPEPLHRGNRIQVPVENDKLTAGETGFLFKKALKVAKQFAAPGAAVYATVPGGPLLVYFIQAMQASGFEFKHQLVWLKNQFVISMADYHHKVRADPIRLAAERCALFHRRP
jgi:hypothetical protein